jgi:hypothetical protein
MLAMRGIAAPSVGGAATEDTFGRRPSVLVLAMRGLAARSVAGTATIDTLRHAK